jgi:predicted methyltransferase
MTWNRRPSLLLLVSAVACSVLACAAPAPRDPAPSPAAALPPPAVVAASTAPPAASAATASPVASAPAEPEASVRPGANEQYLQPDTDVNAWLERFERGGREIFDQRQAILAATGVTAGQVVADVGAGTGLFSRLFARAVGPSGKVFAVDIVPKFLRHIEAEARKQKITNITTVLGQERSAALPADSVDLIFLCDSYHHFEYPRSMNASMYKALRPGGTLILIDFRRVAGESPAWILEHVRAGQEVFTRELQAAGFERVAEVSLLKENYLVRFRKPAAGAAAQR